MKLEEKKLILGLLFIPAYLLQQSILIRCVQFIVLITVYILQGGRFRIAPNLILFSGIVLAYIIRPAGKVLFLFLEFPVTEGALISGLTRSFMLIGLIYISRLSVSSKLTFKGTAGNLIGRVFYYFEAITEGKGTFHFREFYKPGAKRRLISYIDELLISFENKDKYVEKLNVDNNLTSCGPAVLLSAIFILASYIMLWFPFDTIAMFFY